jgi:hypothetical protein
MAQLVGCTQQIDEQYRVDAYESDALTKPPEGTVSRASSELDPGYLTGMRDGKPLARAPIRITHDVLERGRERYEIFCAPCHGIAGDGKGVVVEHGFTEPPSYHEPYLRAAPDGHLFEVITRGFGDMYSFAARIPVKDRWAIVSYIRALQLSQNFEVSRLSPGERARIEEANP